MKTVDLVLGIEKFFVTSDELNAKAKEYCRKGWLLPSDVDIGNVDNYEHKQKLIEWISSARERGAVNVGGFQQACIDIASKRTWQMHYDNLLKLINEKRRLLLDAEAKHLDEVKFL